MCSKQEAERCYKYYQRYNADRRKLPSEASSGSDISFSFYFYCLFYGDHGLWHCRRSKRAHRRIAKTNFQHGRWSCLEQTLLLDYQSYWEPLALIVAYTLNHYGLCGCFTSMHTLSLGLASLVAHLFTTIPVEMYGEIPIQHRFGFSNSNFTARSDLTSKFGIVSAKMLCGGQNIAWIMFNASYIPFSLAPSKISPKSSNATAPTYVCSV